jgi:hypothetical protein
MTSAQAILAGAILIAASVVFVSTIHPADAQRGGPYMLEHHSNPTANAGVFRLDTGSGEVSYCYLIGTSGDLTCSRAVK